MKAIKNRHINYSALFVFFFLFHFFFLLLTEAKAQERFGIANCMYAGINSVWLNPASPAGCPFSYDLNLITAHTYIDNNYIYLYKANLPAIKSNGKNSIVAHNIYNLNNGITSNIKIYDKYKNRNVNVFENFLLQGPSILLSFDKWSFSIITGLRESFSGLNINNKVAKIGFEGMTYKPLSHQYIYVPDFRINASLWSEIGFNVATVLKHNKRMLLKGGFTYKYLIGFTNMYLLNHSSHIYYPNDDDMYFYWVNQDFGHSIPESNFTIGGAGHSVDLGISYQHGERLKLKSHRGYHYNADDCPAFCKPNPYLLYRWKLGISLLDMGYINFNRNVKTYEYRNASSDWVNFANWSPGDIKGIDNDISSHFAGDSVAKSLNDNYKSMLPMALSIQYDYQIVSEYYINCTLVQRIPHFNNPGIDRVNSFSITPRLDNPYFGVALPIILYEYMYPRIGLSFRLFNKFVIGTDKIGSFVNNRLSGMDLYFSIKLNAFNPCKTNNFK